MQVPEYKIYANDLPVVVRIPFLQFSGYVAKMRAGAIYKEKMGKPRTGQFLICDSCVFFMYYKTGPVKGSLKPVSQHVKVMSKWQQFSKLIPEMSSISSSPLCVYCQPRALPHYTHTNSCM